MFAPFETLNKAPSRLGRKRSRHVGSLDLSSFRASIKDHCRALYLSVMTLFSQKEKRKRWRICNRGIDGVKISFRIWIYLVRWRAKNRTSVRARNARANGPSEAIKRFCIQAWKAFLISGIESLVSIYDCERVNSRVNNHFLIRECYLLTNEERTNPKGIWIAIRFPGGHVINDDGAKFRTIAVKYNNWNFLSWYFLAYFVAHQK